MIAETKDYVATNRPRDTPDVHSVYVATSEAEAFQEGARLRRTLTIGLGWKVRTQARKVKSAGLTVRVWVVSATRTVKDTLEVKP